MPNLAAENRVLAVLGGSSLPAILLASWANSATFIAAADSGADALLAAGVTPDLVVGDLDSVVANHGLFKDLRHLPDQYATDCDKLLSELADLGHESVTLANVEGDLPDHVLATYHSAAKSRLSCRLLMARGFGHILAGPFEGRFPAQARVSLLPLTVCEGAHLSGVRWSIANDRLDPVGFSSISNESVGDEIGVALQSGAAFLFIEGSNEPIWP